jgi:alpha/beta superfamily hydrolase
MSAHDERVVRFETDDGVSIVGDLVVPTGCRAAAIVCHPHPQFGGNRFNPVVEAVHRALPPLGIASLRFDFRQEFGDGVGERLDALAALAEIARLVPGVPRVACGYSFGAMITLSLDHPDLAAKVLIAPPLGHITAEPGVAVPTLVLTPAHDQFAPPGVARPIVESWTDAEFEVIDMADHFIAGRSDAVAARAATWVSDRWPPRSPL